MKGRWCGVHWNNRALLSLLQNQPSLPLRGLKDKVCDDLVETILMVMCIRFLFEKLRTFLQWSTYFSISSKVITQRNCKVWFTRKSFQQYHRGWVFNYQALKATLKNDVPFTFASATDGLSERLIILIFGGTTTLLAKWNSNFCSPNGGSK